MNQLLLELYVEGDDDRELAQRSAADLQALIGEIAVHVSLEICPLRVHSIRRSRFDWGGTQREVPYHDPSTPDRQTLLITTEDIGAQGWGWPGRSVVSKNGLTNKARRGGNPADILIHEWIHTLEGREINGRVVPFVDRATECGFTPTIGPDGEDRWDGWYRYALGG